VKYSRTVIMKFTIFAIEIRDSQIAFRRQSSKEFTYKALGINNMMKTMLLTINWYSDPCRLFESAESRRVLDIRNYLLLYFISQNVEHPL
jgi:hypothetical protein